MQIPLNEINSRRQKYQSILSKRKVSALLITSPSHLYFLTNFSYLNHEVKEAIGVVTRDTVRLFVPQMHQGQVTNIFPSTDVTVVTRDRPFWEVIAETLANTKVGFEADNLLYLEYAFLKKKGAKLVPLVKDFDVIRMEKSSTEIAILTEAEDITQQALLSVLSTIKTGQTELQIARKLDEWMTTLGADGVAFPTIVAFGPHSANPHYIPGNVALTENTPILIDMGAKKDGYCGDLTRTYYWGKTEEEFIVTHQLVLEAQAEALNLLKPGASVNEIDKAVRKQFEKSGQLNYYLHTTGHGLGIDVHEFPTLSSISTGQLLPSMVVTIEPGLYYPSWGGVRIEDVAVITESGYELLSTISRDWKIPTEV